MPTIHWGLLHVASATPGLVLLAYLARGHRDRSRNLIVLFCVGSLTATALSLWGPRVGGANHWISHFSALVSVLTLVPGLAWWPTSRRQREFWIWVTAGFVVVWALLVGGVEDRASFSQLGYSLYALVVLAVALWVLLAKSLETTLPLHRQGWFWMTAGIGAYAAATLVYTRR